MHILFGEENAASIDEIIAQHSDRFYCVPTAIVDVIQQLRQGIRQHVADLRAARQMEHGLLLLESLTAAQAAGRAFWSGAPDLPTAADESA